MSDSVEPTIVDRVGRAWTISELAKRVTSPEPRIVLVREIPSSNAAIYTALAAESRKLAEPWGAAYVSVIDLTEATARPDPEMMKAIVTAARATDCLHSAIVKPASIVVKAILKFVMHRAAGLIDNSVHDTREEAMHEARQVLRRAESEGRF